MVDCPDSAARLCGTDEDAVGIMCSFKVNLEDFRQQKNRHTIENADFDIAG
jgi:hypothetical protein